MLSRLENGTQFFGLFLQDVAEEDNDDSEAMDEADEVELILVNVLSRLALRIAIGSIIGLSMA